MVIKMQFNKFVYFWSGVFSQFYPCNIKDCLDLKFNCAEQFMMYHKAVAMKDIDTASKILQETSPPKQKALGREVKNYNEELWCKERINIVYLGNYYKFTQNKELLDVLLKTQGSLLVEASPFDKIWGIGLDRYDAAKTSPDLWPGKNYLGKVLTLLREDLLNNVDPHQDVYERFKNMGWL